MDTKPLAGLSSSLRALLKINIAITVAAVFTGLFDYYSYATLPSRVDPNETILLSDVVTAIVGLVQVVLLIILGFVFLKWIYRTNNNLRALSGQAMTFTPGWSVGWFFIPFANLFKPYQVMKEIWQVSHKNRAVGLSIVGWWWTLFILSGVLGRIAVKIVLRADDAAGYMASSLANIASDALDVVLNIVALILVTRIGVAYSENFVEQDARADSGPVAQRML